jgi:hypothetical protein
MSKILKPSDRICLFCGQPEQEHWEDYEKYYECNCPGAIETRKIQDEIKSLEQRLPKTKYEVTSQRVLRRVR